MGLAEAGDHRLRRQRGQVADGRDAHPPEPLERRRTDSPQPPDRQAGGGRPAPPLGRTSKTPGPGVIPSGDGRGLASTEASLARNLFGATPTEQSSPSSSWISPRSRRAIVTPSPSSARAPVTSRNASSRASGSTSGVTRAKMSRTSRLTAEYSAWSPGRNTARRAQPSRRRRRHRREDPVPARLVRRRGDHPATSGSPDHDRLSPQLGPAAQLARDEEGVHVDVEDRARRHLAILPSRCQPLRRRRARRPRRSSNHRRATRPERLVDDPPRELRLPRLAVAEDDRELDDATAGPDEPVGHLDLEAVALAAHRRVVHRLQRRRAVGAVAGRRVVHGQAEHAGGVAVPPSRQPAPAPGPALGRAARHVPAPDGEVGAVFDVGDEGREDLGVVGEIGVDLHADLGAGVDRQAKPVPIGGSEPELAPAAPRARSRRARRRGAGRGRPSRPCCRRRRPGCGRRGRPTRIPLTTASRFSTSLWVGITATTRTGRDARRQATRRSAMGAIGSARRGADPADSVRRLALGPALAGRPGGGLRGDLPRRAGRSADRPQPRRVAVRRRLRPAPRTRPVRRRGDRGRRDERGRGARAAGARRVARAPGPAPDERGRRGGRGSRSTSC